MAISIGHSTTYGSQTYGSQLGTDYKSSYKSKFDDEKEDVQNVDADGRELLVSQSMFVCRHVSSRVSRECTLPLDRLLL